MNTLHSLMTSTRPAAFVMAKCEKRDITWAQFVYDVSLLSETLSQHHVSTWSLAFEDSYLFATAFFALCHSGKSLVLPGNLQSCALKELSHHCGGILHDKRVLPPENMEAISLPLFESASFDPHVAPSLKRLNNLKDIDLTLYTSGSSGEPKAIKKQCFQLQEEINQLEYHWGEPLKDTVIFSTVSHQHIYGLLFRVLWPLLSGRPFFTRDVLYPEQLLSHADENHTLITSPALLTRLLDPAKKTYRAIFSSGGPLSPMAAKQTQMLLGSLPIEVYGSTETGGIGFRQQTCDNNTPWHFFNDIDARLDKDGCLILRSPYIDPLNWYPTSDLCTLFNGNQFLLKGRADRVIKIEEKRVSLTEIERRLCQTPWVLDAATGFVLDKKRQVITAILVLSPEGEERLARLGAGKFKLTLRSALRAWLEPIAIPRKWRMVEEIPQNNQGKRQHKAIEALFCENE